MEVDEQNIVTRQCYKLKQPIYDNLNIIYTSSNSMLVLWNKYQIFIYENVDLHSAAKAILPEFQLQHVIASNNYLVCLDNTGNIHLGSLKFKNSAQNNLVIPFQPRDQGINSCIGYNQDYAICLKFEADTYFLYVHRVSKNFLLEKILILLTPDEQFIVRQNPNGKCLMVYHAVDKENMALIKTLFKVQTTQNSCCDLLVLSFDNFTVYGCVLGRKMEEDEVMLVKLYSCPAEICNLEIVDCGNIYLLISLKMGTLIRFCFNETEKSPDIVHFNTSLHRTLALKDSFVYTDGATMWKSEDTFTEEKRTQFFVKDTFDFLKCGDQIVCTTFGKFMYKFYLDDQQALIIPKDIKEYYSAEIVLGNYDFMDEMFKEAEYNQQLLVKVKVEQDYIAACGLANKQDIVKKAIESNVFVYENYEEIQDKVDLRLTEELQAYFVPQTWLLLIRISNSGIYEILNNVISNLLQNIRIHITIYSNENMLKTTTLTLDKPLKKVEFLTPFLSLTATDIRVNIKLVVKIPGALDSKTTWAILYKEDKSINCEHFIKMTSRKTAISLKEPSKSLNDQLQSYNLIEFGSLFQFHDTSILKESEMEWTFYVKLSNNYKLLFKSENSYKKYFNPIKSKALTEKLAAKDFLDAKNSTTLIIGSEKITLKIQNDGFSFALLVIKSCNAKIAYSVRNFFSDMLYDDYQYQGVVKEYINSNFYTTTEFLQKALKDFFTTPTSFEEFMPIMDKFEKHIIGTLPL